MTELKTLKDLNLSPTDNGDFVAKKRLKAEAVKIIIALRKCYRDDGFDCPNLQDITNLSEEEKEIITKLNIEYSWISDGYYSNEAIGLLIKFIKWQNNLTEDDLKDSEVKE